MITNVDDDRAEVILLEGDRETRFPLASAEGMFLCFGERIGIPV